MPPKSEIKHFKCSSCSMTFCVEKSFEKHKEEGQDIGNTQDCNHSDFKSCTVIGLTNHISNNPSHADPAVATQEFEILNGPSVPVSGKAQKL